MRASIARQLQLVKRGRSPRNVFAKLTVTQPQQRVPATMRKFLPLLFCFLLSIFTAARAMKPVDAISLETDTKPLVDDTNTQKEPNSEDDDSADDPSKNQGDDINDPDGVDAPADSDVGDDDEGDDDSGGDDGSGNQSE
jgi:hypothetical protein